MSARFTVYAIFVALLGVTAGCHGWDEPTGITPHSGQDWNLKACVAKESNGELVPTGSYCYAGEVCGGGFPNVGCPAGDCCADDNDEQGTTYGARRIHPQRSLSEGQ